jgi:hypothetical protein
MHPAPPAPPAMSRRHFARVAVGGAATVALLAAACSSGDDDETGTAGATTTAAGGSGGEPGGSTGTGDMTAVLYASPTCGCCGEYATFLGENGFTVDVQRTSELATIKADHGVPAEVESCHTTLIGDWWVEGHVPLEALDKLLAEAPAVEGIALPGMPVGTPGMPGPKEAPYEVLAVTGGQVEPYLTV